MKVLQCEMCGSQDLLKQDGVYVCQACGTKYSVEETKKMMVEDTVQVAGIVKLDKSDELKNLYILAERARKSNNSDNAVRYYNQILEKDPNSWQANFYLVYFKAKNTNIGSIPNVCYDLINCYQSTFELLIEDKGEDISSELDMLIEDIYEYSFSIINSTSDLGDFVKYRVKALEILSKFGDKLVEYYGNTYRETAVKTWEKAMEVYRNILISPNKAIAESKARLIAFYYDIEELNTKIKKNQVASYDSNNFKDDIVVDSIIPGLIEELKSNIQKQKENPEMVCTEIVNNSGIPILQIGNFVGNSNTLELSLYLVFIESDYERFKSLSIYKDFNCSYNAEGDFWECNINFGEDCEAAAKFSSKFYYEYYYGTSDLSDIKIRTWINHQSIFSKGCLGLWISLITVLSTIGLGVYFLVVFLLLNL